MGIEGCSRESKSRARGPAIASVAQLEETERTATRNFGHSVCRQRSKSVATWSAWALVGLAEEVSQVKSKRLPIIEDHAVFAQHEGVADAAWFERQ